MWVHEKIVVRIDGEHPELQQEFQGVPSKLVKGATLFFPDFHWQNGKKVASCPPELLQMGSLLVEAAEQGGGRSSTGAACIICGMKGERLKPFKLQHFANGEHAFFVGKRLIRIRADHDKSGWDISITLLAPAVVEGGAGVELKEETIWRGESPEELPFAFSSFQEAVQAATAKACHYHCRKAYYILE